MKKHTPGPWNARPDDQGIHAEPICTVWSGQPGGGGSAVIACVPLSTRRGGKQIESLPYAENARLIAAAPIPQDLYDSEINFEIEPFWDGGFYIRLGDHMNGYRAEGDCRTYVEALEQLRDWAIVHCPNSEFAEQYDPVGEMRAAHVVPA